jgi:hypothetical protein
MSNSAAVPNRSRNRSSGLNDVRQVQSYSFPGGWERSASSRATPELEQPPIGRIPFDGVLRFARGLHPAFHISQVLQIARTEGTRGACVASSGHREMIEQGVGAVKIRLVKRQDNPLYPLHLSALVRGTLR